MTADDSNFIIRKLYEDISVNQSIDRSIDINQSINQSIFILLKFARTMTVVVQSRLHREQDSKAHNGTNSCPK